MAETTTETTNSVRTVRAYVAGGMLHYPSVPSIVELPMMHLLVLPQVSAKIQATLVEGELRYPDGKWKTQSVWCHLHHAIHHAYKWWKRDKSEDHAGHLAVRLLMAIERLLGESNG